MTHAPSVLADDPYENFEELGAGEVAYVRRISPKDLKKNVPGCRVAGCRSTGMGAFGR